MVPFIWSPKYVPRYEAVHATWGKRCDVLKFFIDPIIGDEQIGFYNMTVPSKALASKDANLLLPNDVVVLHDMKRPWHTCEGEGDCGNIWEKVWRSLLWIHTNGDSDLADWFVKVDGDTFLFPENMKHYIEKHSWSPDDHHYFGHKLRHTYRPKIGQSPIIAGAAVFFSRATVDALASLFHDFKVNDSNEHKGQCVDAHVAHEEVITAICLKKKLNISAEHALDDMGNELVTIQPVEEALQLRRGIQGMDWYWKKKPETHPVTGKKMHQCCGDLPLAFHGYKDPQWLYKIENELYPEDTPNSEREVWKNYIRIKQDQEVTNSFQDQRVTNSYFARVTKAMTEQINN